MKSGDPNGTDSEGLELFEAISHPIRIRILYALGKGRLRFWQLKQSIATRSGGHLAFHLSKLGYLVNRTSGGYYVLTRDGVEALASVKILREHRVSSRHRKKGPKQESRHASRASA